MIVEKNTAALNPEEHYQLNADSDDENEQEEQVKQNKKNKRKRKKRKTTKKHSNSQIETHSEDENTADDVEIE